MVFAKHQIIRTENKFYKSIQKCLVIEVKINFP